MNMRRIDSPNAPAAAGGYAQAIEVSNVTRTLYISGQIPVTRDGTLPETFRDQVRVAWGNLEAQLGAAGMTLQNLVNVTTYLPDRSHLMEYRTIRNEILAGHAPTMTVVIAGVFDENWMLEVEGIAVA
jgi:enamine deaminase RidA (YjgF/YER057c/UK114 family)